MDEKSLNSEHNAKADNFSKLFKYRKFVIFFSKPNEMS